MLSTLRNSVLKQCTRQLRGFSSEALAAAAAPAASTQSAGTGTARAPGVVIERGEENPSMVIDEIVNDVNLRILRCSKTTNVNFFGTALRRRMDHRRPTLLSSIGVDAVAKAVQVFLTSNRNTRQQVNGRKALKNLKQEEVKEIAQYFLDKGESLEFPLLVDDSFPCKKFDANNFIVDLMYDGDAETQAKRQELQRELQSLLRPRPRNEDGSLPDMKSREERQAAIDKARDAVTATFDVNRIDPVADIETKNKQMKQKLEDIVSGKVTNIDTAILRPVPQQVAVLGFIPFRNKRFLSDADKEAGRRSNVTEFEPVLIENRKQLKADEMVMVYPPKGDSGWEELELAA